MPRLGASSQGESRLRMLRIVRRGDRHDARDLTVSIRFEGDFATAFREGRSEGLIPGETLKTFVHKTNALLSYKKYSPVRQKSAMRWTVISFVLATRISRQSQ